VRAPITASEDIEALAAKWAPSDGSSAVAALQKIRNVDEIGSIRTYVGQKIEYIIDGILAAGTVTAITGYSGCGKSTLATSMCGSVQHGVPFAGLATQRRQVLVLDRENPLPIVVERFDRLDMNDSENFRYWGGWLPEEAAEPGSPIVTEWLRACEPKPLIVVDSLVAFHGGDENDATQTRAFMQKLRRLADLGGTVVCLHHSDKSETSKDYRGSSDFKASIDVGYHLANLGDPSRLVKLRLRAFKARFSVLPEVILNYIDGVFRIDTRAPIVTVTETLRDLLIAHPNIGKKEFEDLATNKGIARGKARDFINASVASGHVGVDHGTRNSRHHSWIGSGPRPLVSDL
jgi:archaellum biogenesis ATPase FlaH